MTAFTTEKIAVFAPMPSARVRMVTAVNPGVRTRLRAAWRRSRTKVSMPRLDGAGRRYVDLYDLRVHGDLHRAAIRVRHGAAAFGQLCDLGELPGVCTLQSVRGSLELRRQNLDAGVTLVGGDRRPHRRTLDRHAFSASDRAIECHRVACGMRRRHQLFGAGLAARIADAGGKRN